MSYRELSAQPQAQIDFDEFLENLKAALTDGRRDPNEVVRDILCEILIGNSAQPSASAKLPLASRA